MIQDIGAEKLNNTYSSEIKPEKSDTLFCFKDNDVLVCECDTTIFPQVGEINQINNIIYLFSIGKSRYFLSFNENTKAPSKYSYCNVRVLRRRSDILQSDLFSMFTAYHLYRWYSTSKFCGSCGSPTNLSDNERAVYCKKCGNISYPRINPAVIVGVTNNDKLLITRYAKNRGVAFDALVAGFTEIGETLEQTVEREVMEEVGLKVKNIRYYKSQPWGLSGTILAGFFCDVDGSDKIILDQNELSSAIWTSRDKITGQPDNMSLTNEMMTIFRDGKIF